MANVLFTYELQRKLKQRGSKIQAFCVHPGVVDTELQRNLPIDWYRELTRHRTINRPKGRCQRPNLRRHERRFRKRRRREVLLRTQRRRQTGAHAFRPSNAFSLDEENWARAWKESERLTGIRFRRRFIQSSSFNTSKRRRTKRGRDETVPNAGSCFRRRRRHSYSVVCR